MFIKFKTKNFLFKKNKIKISISNKKILLVYQI